MTITPKAQPEPKGIVARAKAVLTRLRRTPSEPTATERAHSAFDGHTCTKHQRPRRERHQFHDPEVGKMAEAAESVNAMMAVSYFWVGTTAATWDTTTSTNWSLTSGGAGGAGVPGASDTATFDSHSGVATITTAAGVSVAAVVLNNGFNGNVTFGAAVTVSGTVTLFQGTLNTNSQTCTWGGFNFGGSQGRTFTAGASAITITAGGITAGTTALTITANTAVMTFTVNALAFNPLAINYNGMSFVITGTGSVIEGGAASNFTCANFTYAPSSSASGNSLQFTGNPTITGTFTVTGSVAPGRVLVQSSTMGATRTITAAVVSISTGVDLQDITGAGAGSWNLVSVLAGDAQGNSGITFAAGATQFRVGAAGNWSDTTHWASSSGGTGGTGRVPLPQDTANIDSNATGTVTADCSIMGGNVNWTGFSGTWSVPIIYMVLGNWTTSSTMSLSGSSGLTFAGRGSQTIQSNGFNIAFGTNRTIAINAVGGSYTLLDDFSHSTGPLVISSGTFTANGHNVTATNISSSAGSTVTMGSGTWNLGTTGVLWSMAAGATVNAGTSTILFARATAGALTFTGGGHTYHNVQVVSGSLSTLTISGNNTLDALTATSSPIVFTAGSVTTITSGAGFQLNGTSGTPLTMTSTTPGSAYTISIASGIVIGAYLTITDSTATGGASFWAPNGTLVSNDSGWTVGTPGMTGAVVATSGVFTHTLSSNGYVSSGSISASSGGSAVLSAQPGMDGEIDVVSEAEGIIAAKETIIGQIDVVSVLNGTGPSGDGAMTGEIDAKVHVKADGFFAKTAPATVTVSVEVV